jgi:arylsulfatase A
MDRRRFINGVIGSSIALLSQSVIAKSQNGPSGDDNQKSALNIIFILMDDLGWGDLGCYGHRVIQTPHIDNLAKESCKFTDFYVPMPICSPTRAACITGRDPNRYGFKHVINTGMVNPNVHVPEVHHLPVEEPSLPRQLQTIGYHTGTIGKWHLSLTYHPTEPTPHDYGFDSYFIHTGGGSLYKGPATWSRDGNNVSVDSETWFPQLYIDESFRFIEASRRLSKPFYLNLWPYSPHVTEEAAQEYQDRYSHRTEHEKVYYGCVTQMDDQLGRLFDYLRQQNLMDETIIIFTSDNGNEPAVNIYNHEQARRGSSGGLRGSKHVIYEGGIRVPGIIRWPGMSRPGSVSNVPVSVLDLFPTLCAATKAPLPEGWNYDGADFRPAFDNKPIHRPHALYWQCEYAMRTFVGPDYHSPPLAIREDNWKLMCDMNFDNVKLYNLDWDQAEQFSVAKEYPERVKSMLQQLKSIYHDVNGPYQKRADYLNPELLKN